MPSKKQQPAPIREIPAHRSTGEFLTGTEEQAKAAKDRFYVDLGPVLKAGEPTHLDKAPFYVIRDRETGDVLERKNTERSAVDDECRRRNEGLPINAVSLGKLIKNPDRVRRGQIRAGTVVIPSPTQLVERIYSHPPTRQKLAALAAEQQPLNRDGVTDLLRDVLDPTTWAALTGSLEFYQAIGDVLQQLARKFGVRRVDRT